MKIPLTTKSPVTERIICWKYIDEMLEAGCEGTEIANYFGINEDTLYNAVKARFKIGFSAYRAKKRASGDMLLRKKSFDMAIEGNVPLIIFTLKNRLGMKDNPDQSADTVKIPIPKWGEVQDAEI